jgi:hypothetical protein
MPNTPHHWPKNSIMKLTALLFTLLITGHCYAQNVPNGDFENWQTLEDYSPQGFHSLGLVSQTTDHKVGERAVKLENKKKAGGNLIGAIANTEFDQGFDFGGMPYEDRPLSLKFWAKYDLTTNDKAHIVCYFKSNSTIIGVINFQIEGTSNDKFLEYSIPITWYSVGLPDSVTFFASSTSLYNNYARGDGYIILDDIRFSTINTRNAPLPNGDFENWDTTGTAIPQNWYRTEDFLIAEEGDDFGYSWVTKVDGQEGSAIRMQNRKIEDDIIAGVLVTHNDFDNIFKPSFKVDKQWKYLEGYYKYQPQNGDSAAFTIPMYASGTLIGGAEYKIGKATTEWTYFAIPLTYFVPLVDSSTLLISSSDAEKPLGDSSTLWLDQLRFADWTIGVEKHEFNRINIYPSPSSDYVQVSFDNPGESSIEISDLQGRIIYKISTQLSENQIDISSLKQGVYYLTIENNQYRTSKKIIKDE